MNCLILIFIGIPICLKFLDFKGTQTQFSYYLV